LILDLFRKKISKIEPQVSPECGKYDENKNNQYAKWELEMLSKSAIIIVGLNIDEKHLPGLTTRTEAGYLLANRRNLIMWEPKGSYRTKYIKYLFEERPYLWRTDSLCESAEMVLAVWDKNWSMIVVDKTNSESTNIYPNGCDPFYLEISINNEKKTSKEIYVYIPILDLFGYGVVIYKNGNFQLHKQNKENNIFLMNM